MAKLSNWRRKYSASIRTNGPCIAPIQRPRSPLYQNFDENSNFLKLLGECQFIMISHLHDCAQNANPLIAGTAKQKPHHKILKMPCGIQVDELPVSGAPPCFTNANRICRHTCTRLLLSPILIQQRQTDILDLWGTRAHVSVQWSSCGFWRCHGQHGR